MSNQECILDKFHKVLEKLSEEFETKNTVVLVAVEINPDGFPVSRVKHLQGSAANTIAGLIMIDRTVKVEIDKWHDKIDAVGNVSDKINELFQKITGAMPKNEAEVEALLERMKDEKPEVYERLKDVIKDIKNSFGG
jgi:hypothetical protein